MASIQDIKLSPNSIQSGGQTVATIAYKSSTSDNVILFRASSGYSVHPQSIGAGYAPNGGTVTCNLTIQGPNGSCTVTSSLDASSDFDIVGVL
jgi:hypothetical protein